MKQIFKHLGLMAVVSLLLILGVLWYLKIYTKHDATLVTVENMDGVLVQKAIEQLDAAGLEGVVIDTVYKDGAKKLSVINQNPEAGQKVKPGRKIYLVINTDKVPMVEIPDLAEKTSLSQAKNMLARRHLRLGDIIKKPHPSVMSKNDEPVLAMYEHGTTTSLTPGGLIERNSKIDLVIGVSIHGSDSDSTSSSAAPEADDDTDLF